MNRLVAHRRAAPVDAAAAFRLLFADAQNTVWLDASDGSGWSYLASAATARTDWTGDDPFDELDDALRAHPIDASAAPAGMRFRLGWVGWFGYELWRATAARRPRPASHDSAFVFVNRMLAIDHAAGEAWLVALDTADGAQWLRSAADALDTLGPPARVTLAPTMLAPTMLEQEGPGPEQAAGLPDPAGRRAVWRHDDPAYLGLVDSCLSAIARGDAYQLCLTNTATVEGRVDPLRTYSRVRELSPSHHGGFLRIGGTALLSASPEVFLRVGADGALSTRPIKGTRRRGRNAVEDAALRAELVASDKERAENLMIVDLMRNDLSRVARLGTVRVSSLLAVETYAQVHQLVSTVQAELDDGLTAVDAVRALFPAGSMTGAPKIRAIELLDELEGGPRGVYSGAFGYLGLDGAVDLAMVIRSIVVTAERATVGAGGGITALSDPAEELAEMHLKAAPLLAALGIPAP